MNQGINFYSEILRVRNIPLSFYVMKNFMYGLALFMVIATVVLGIIQLKNESDLKDLEKQQSETLTKLQDQESKISSKVDRDQIIKELDMNNKLYEKNKRLLGDLKTLMESGSGGFSKYLVSLSNSVPKGLWLTKIELTNSGKSFALSGKTVEPNLTTAFITALNKEKPFTGKTLNLFDMVYDKSESILEFKLQTGTE